MIPPTTFPRTGPGTGPGPMVRPDMGGGAGPMIGPEAGGPRPLSGPSAYDSPFGFNGAGYDPYSFWPVARAHMGTRDPWERFRNMAQAGGINPETVESWQNSGIITGGWNGRTQNPFEGMQGGPANITALLGGRMGGLGGLGGR